MRWLRCAGCVAGLGCLAAMCCAAVDTSASTRTRAQKKIVALSPWEQAERGRDALEAIPEDVRTRADYARAMDGYRAIYHASPRDGHAPAAVNAVAELLAEQGRSLHDAKSLQGAVGQYEFLRTQYPGSSLGVQALLTEGQIEQNDLGDADAAKEKYKLLLKEHPKSEFAEEARAALASLVQGLQERRDETDAVAVSRLYRTLRFSGAARHGAPNAAVTPTKTTIQRPVTGTVSSLPAMARTGVSAASDVRELADVDAQTRPEGSDAQGAKRSGQKALVTGIRHWSTTTYTRVAIDLGDNVTYEAARVPNPDRIYFDLHGTRLAQELVGKSFAVTDDGFLKKIRAAQFSDDMTRVVLDVSDVSEYSAFLLPNPYRLIIDIHGGQAVQAVQGVGSREQGVAGKDGTDVPAPRVAATVKPTTAKPVPNTVATKSASTSSDVADLSEMPGRVEATKKPTSKPISAGGEGTAGWEQTNGCGGRSHPSRYDCRMGLQCCGWHDYDGCAEEDTEE